MRGLPPFLGDYLISISVGARHAAYLVLDGSGRVLEVGGDVERYGLAGIAPGEDAVERASYLEGMLPPGAAPIELPALDVGTGFFADVHIGDLPDEDGRHFVLLLDATRAVRLQSALHQRSNDLDLLRERLERDETASTSGASISDFSTVLDFSPRATVLRAHLRFRAGDAEAELTHEHLGEARRAQRLAGVEIRRHAGLLIGTSAAELFAVFGVRSSTGVPARQAVEAARAILSVLERSGGLVAGIGIATGEAIVSLGSEGAPPVVLGPPIDDALRLSLIASTGGVLADEATAVATQGFAFDEWDAAHTRAGPLFVHRGRPPGHGELSGVLSALGVAMFEVRSGGLLTPAGPVPRWADGLLAWEGGASGGLRPADELSFLANFLVDAAGFWERGEVGFLRSGNWTELEASSGAEHAFEALALVGAGGRRLLLLDFLGEAFEERQGLLQQARETRLSFESLQGEVQKKDVLLHCIVHDLKAPLSSIVGALSLLTTTELDREKTAALLEIGLRQARRQKELISQVLDVFAAEIREIEAVEVDPKRAPDAARCGREGVENYRPAFEQSGIELTWDPGSFVHGEARVVGTYDRLERALANLLENALRFSPEGTRTEVSMKDEGGSLLLSVSDRGPGVDADKVDHLFDRFFRGSGGGSSGLGLYYCSITLRAWGGSVGYEPRAGGGAVFWMRLVRAVAPNP